MINLIYDNDIIVHLNQLINNSKTIVRSTIINQNDFKSIIF